MGGLAEMRLPYDLSVSVTNTDGRSWTLLNHSVVLGCSPPAHSWAHKQAPTIVVVIEIGVRERRLPAPPSVVWESLVNPGRPGTRPWLDLLPDEVAPRVLDAEKPTTVVWSSLWPSRPNDEVHLELTEDG